MVELKDVDVNEINLDGIIAPLLNLTHADRVDWKLRFQGGDYAFASSVLVKGHGAILPQRVRQAQDEGRRVLLVQRGERYYLYLTQAVTPPSQ